MDPQRVRTFLRPSSVALVGAANKSMFSTLAFQNLEKSGMLDHTFLVNRRGAETHGRPTVASCTQIGEPVDMALLMIPQAGTLDAMSDAAAAGIRNAVVLTSGYGEAGETGKQAQRDLVAHARDLDMLLLGPNNLGFTNVIDQRPVAAIPNLPRRSGPVALLSQSGASSSAMIDFATDAGVGLSYIVTLGNEAMLTAGDLIDALVDDEETRAFAVFIETVRNPLAFARSARRAAEAGKAIVVLKAGSSVLSARTAAAHTGALVGDDKVIDAVFRDLGVIRVDSIEDMLTTAGVAAATGRLRQSGIGVVSISGGACDIVADRAEDLGANLPQLDTVTTKALTAVMPDYGTVQNPLDVTGAAIIDPSLFTSCITAMSQDPSVGVVAAVLTFPWRPFDGPYIAQQLINAVGEGAATSEVPVILVNQVSQPITETSRSVLDAGGVPIAVAGLGQAVVALGKIGWWSAATPLPAPPNDDRSERSVPTQRRGERWSEHQAREALLAAGIPVVDGAVVTSADEAVTAAATFGTPVAMKLVSPDILHKTDIGGVRLGVTGQHDVRSTFEEILEAGRGHGDAQVDGVLVSPMKPDGVDLLVGVVRDAEWGLVLAVAVGGVFVEVLDDSALALAPVNSAGARSLLRRLRGAGLLDGARGRPPADLDLLAATIARISQLAVELGDDLESIEVNPLRVHGDEVEALDAVVTWRSA